MKDQNLAKMSVDQLWTLHEEICAILSTKMDAEKHELERRLGGRLRRRCRQRPGGHQRRHGLRVVFHARALSSAGPF